MSISQVMDVMQAAAGAAVSRLLLLRSLLPAAVLLPAPSLS